MSDSPVRVYVSGNAFDGLLTKGHLEAEGIKVLMKGEGGDRTGRAGVPLGDARGRGSRSGDHPGDRVRSVRNVGRGRARSRSASAAARMTQPQR